MSTHSQNPRQRQDLDAITVHLLRLAYLEAAPTRLVGIGPAQDWERATLERNWLVYRLAPNGDKLAKLPASPAGRAPVSVHDAASLTFAGALDALDKLGMPYGLGYLPRPGSMLIGFDFDKCLMPWNDGPDDWVADLLAHTHTWAERSPSGLGVRVVAGRTRCDLTLDKEANGCGYFAGGGRFFTITFDLLPGRMHRVYPERGLTAQVLERITGRPAPTRAPVREPSGAPHWFERLSPERQDEEVERMLTCLTDPKFGLDYQLWLEVSFALHRATDSNGFEVWDAWCQRLPGYHAERNRKKWDSGLYERGQGGNVTVGTLIMHARQNGYFAPKDAVDRRVRQLARRLGRALFRAEAAAIIRGGRA